MEQGKHFDYSIQYESFDIMPEPLMEQGYCLEEPLPNEFMLESSIEKADYSGAKIEPESSDINIPSNLENPVTLGEETHDLHDNASQFHQFQQELKSLVIPGSDIELTDDQRLIQLENLEQRLENRLQRVESIANHADPVCRDRLQLQVEIERSFFLEHSSKLSASILEKKERVMHIDNILAYRREAALSGQAYKTYICEWCRKSVRDPSYFSIDSNLAKQVERIRSSEKTRWAAFDERALKSNWDLSKRAQEAKILQQRLDQEIMINLERSLGLSHEIELSR